MSLHVYWPATACVTMFVLGVIMLLLRYGPKYCKTRNVAFADDKYVDNIYDHSVTDA